ncbi:MAG: hypothetical protein WA484_09545, partial [Solirubrobacteraceae bacterium]
MRDYGVWGSPESGVAGSFSLFPTVACVFVWGASPTTAGGGLLVPSGLAGAVTVGVVVAGGGGVASVTGAGAGGG